MFQLSGFYCRVLGFRGTMHHPSDPTPWQLGACGRTCEPQLRPKGAFHAKVTPNLGYHNAT